MENLKQISAKIDAETLKRLDDLATKKKYCKRNSLINHILKSVVDGTSDYDIWKILQYWSNDKQEIKITVTLKNRSEE